MHSALRKIDHRPWPVPPGRWTSRQNWRDLLFAHWPVKAADIRQFVPSRIEIQEFDGTSWVGLVPFRIEGLTQRPFPALPGISTFIEMNLRLYVELDGKPGVWFISLDASSRLAVWAARRFFHLPYFHAAMSVKERGTRFLYRSERSSSERRVAFEGTYWSTSESYEAKPGSLDHFLTERYCLYSQAPDGRIFRGEIHHHPWPLERAAADFEENTVADAQGITVANAPAILHFSKGVDVVMWPLREVGM